jgi:hypothetical protein
MDTRAWRLPVPDRQARFFEVDTQTVLDLKQQLLGARPPLHRRCPVVADITDGAQLEQGLLQAGRQGAELLAVLMTLGCCLRAYSEEYLQQDLTHVWRHMLRRTSAHASTPRDAWNMQAP